LQLNTLKSVKALGRRVKAMSPFLTTNSSRML
jgi:hypothetical protein